MAAAEAGLEPWQASAYSLLVFAGSAQFAAVDVIGDGGAALSAIAAGALLNLRSLAFGVVMATALPRAWWKRAAWSQLMVDEPTAIAAAWQEPRWRMYGYAASGLALFVCWNATTLVGALALSSTGSVVTDWGIDAAIPAVFLALLWPRLAGAAQRRTALTGALVALALLPVAPPGVPVVAAAIGVAAGWRGSAPGGRRAATEPAAAGPATSGPSAPGPAATGPAGRP